MRVVPAAVAIAFACSACAGGSDEADAGAVDPNAVELSFLPDEVQTGSEDYLCFGFDAARLAGRAVERITWSPPAGGGVTLHHATAYLMQEAFPDGPLSCTWMPATAVGLHVWAPGDQPLIMPQGFALSIPEATTKIVIQAHVLRTAGAPATPASVALTLAASPPEHLAAWHSTFAKVPAIPPHSQATASSGCRVLAAAHTLFVWPHMHRLGTTFHGAVQRAAGGVDPLVDVPAWDAAHEQTYAVARDLAEGDVLEIGCAWLNPGAAVVTGGFDTTDEMCAQGIISWPADAPRCEPL